VTTETLANIRKQQNINLYALTNLSFWSIINVYVTQDLLSVASRIKNRIEAGIKQN
jgi:hypothetical protein